MASTSGSATAAGSSTQHTDVDIEEDVRSGSISEGADEDMGGVGTPAAEGAQTPQSQDDSDLAPSFYQNNSTKKRQTGSRLADTSATVVGDDDDDDLMEPELPGREERLLDEKIRARYIQELTPWIVLNLLCLPFWLVMSLWLALSALAEIGDIF